jgi:hypothetical protein
LTSIDLYGIIYKKEGKGMVLTKNDFIILSSSYRTIVRILDDTPVEQWSHWIPSGHKSFSKVNAGKGIGLVCSGFSTCPICEYNKGRDKSDQLRNRKIFTFNVLDRTLTKVCPDCKEEYYDIKGKGYPKTCNCGTELPELPEPRNQILLMEKGITIQEQLGEFEASSDVGPVMDYDIIMDTRGTKENTSVTCIPKQKSKSIEEILGKGWEVNKYNLSEVTKPLSRKDALRVLNGEDFFSVVK